jgi:Mrp family chromosome partitioning ATPase
MTRIFEALENAGLEQYNLREVKEEVVPDRQESELALVPSAATRIKPSDGKGAGLYQSIVTLLPGRESRIVQFQGTRKGEGTSTMVRELANFAAMKLKKKVLVLDLNQKTPNQCSHFQVFSQLPPLDDASREMKVTRKDFARVNYSSLYVTQLPSRGISADIICEMPQIGPLLNGLKEEFELVIVDSPAAISCSECLLLSPKVDGVILVVQAGKTRWQAVAKLKEHIMAQDGNILGVVLNKRSYPIPNFIYKRI